MKNLVRFDWAIKRLLRNKANFVVVEGFLSELLDDDIKIEDVLESEGNKESIDNKTTVVDILVQNKKGELIIIEVQHAFFPNYLQRMLFGVSKLINDYINRGEGYEKIKKIISVNIVYFDLGHGADYVYHGTTNFIGMHRKDILELTAIERGMYGHETINKIYPEYYIIKVNDFNNASQDSLDQWINFLKTERIDPNTKARGLKEASETLKILKLTEEERNEYNKFLTECDDNFELIYGNYKRGKYEGKIEGKIEGRIEEKQEVARQCLHQGLEIELISKITGLTAEEIGGLK